VINRANARFRMFRKGADFEAFERVLEEAVFRADGSVSLLAYCVMGNHWHLVIQTHAHRAMGQMMRWLTTTHAGRYRVAHSRKDQDGIGHLYQGRYKSFLIEDDPHLLSVCRYVERNAARASLVERAEDWRWSSLWRWREGPRNQGDESTAMLAPWPVSATGVRDKARFNRPRQWLRTVNTPLNEAELEALRLAIGRGRPFGGDAWVARMVTRHGLESTMRSPGRPRKAAG
jgi:putative transposase